MNIIHLYKTILVPVFMQQDGECCHKCGEHDEHLWPNKNGSFTVQLFVHRVARCSPLICQGPKHDMEDCPRWYLGVAETGVFSLSMFWAEHHKDIVFDITCSTPCSEVSSAHGWWRGRWWWEQSWGGRRGAPHRFSNAQLGTSFRKIARPLEALFLFWLQNHSGLVEGWEDGMWNQSKQ